MKQKQNLNTPSEKHYKNVLQLIRIFEQQQKVYVDKAETLATLIAYSFQQALLKGFVAYHNAIIKKIHEFFEGPVDAYKGVYIYKNETQINFDEMGKGLIDYIEGTTEEKK